MRPTLLALLAGCAAGPSSPAQHAPPAPLDLTVSPFVRGQTATVEATGAAPGGTAILAYSIRGPGAGPCPPALDGGCVGLDRPEIFAQRPVDASGNVQFSIPLPETVPIDTVWMQMGVVGSFPSLSDVVEVDITDLPTCPPRAFHDAEGYGAIASVGQTPTVYVVDTLDDARPPSPGMLRHAVEVASEPRVVVFAVGGEIELLGELVVNTGNLYLAGQTAPGDGITISMDYARRNIFNIVDVHDVIVRHLKFRGGDALVTGTDTCGLGTPCPGGICFNGQCATNNHPLDNIHIQNAQRVMIDHVSLSGSFDENLDIWVHYCGPEGTCDQQGAEDITVQHSILADPYGDPNAPHDVNLLIGATPAFFPDSGYTEPPYTFQSWNGLLMVNNVDVVPLAERVQRIAVHKNLFARASHRNPQAMGRDIRILDNVIYSWRQSILGTTGPTTADIIGNVAIQGDVPSPRAFVHQSWTWNGYISPVPPDNFLYGRPSLHFEDNEFLNGTAPACILQDRVGLTRTPFQSEVELCGDIALTRPTLIDPGPFPPTRVDAMDLLPFGVGANARLDCDGRFVTRRDSMDADVLADVLDMPIASMPSAPDLCADADQDHIYDQWELDHGVDLQPYEDDDGDGWSNLLEFINGSDPLTHDCL